MTGPAALEMGYATRTRRDLTARREVFGDGPTIAVPEDGLEFWRWYAGYIRCGRPYKLQPASDAQTYPEPVRGPALWFSGGVESTYTRMMLAEQGIVPTLLDIADFPVFSGPDRRVGQIHFLCAAVASGLGCGPIYLGMERNDLLLGADGFTHGYVERHPLFARHWSAYQPEHPVVTVCGDLFKEEIISWLHQRRVPITGTCDRLTGGEWCGDCYKCFEAFYTAKAVDIDLGIRLTRAAFDLYHGEYRRYVDSGFRDNVNNAYQQYVRLQIVYGLTFDRSGDCRRDES